MTVDVLLSLALLYISILEYCLGYYKLSATYGVLAFITAIKVLIDVVQG